MTYINVRCGDLITNQMVDLGQVEKSIKKNINIVISGTVTLSRDKNPRQDKSK